MYVHRHIDEFSAFQAARKVFIDDFDPQAANLWPFQRGKPRMVFLALNYIDQMEGVRSAASIGLINRPLKWRPADADLLPDVGVLIWPQ